MKYYFAPHAYAGASFSGLWFFGEPCSGGFHRRLFYVVPPGLKKGREKFRI
jgi:hypothetical protein